MRYRGRKRWFDALFAAALLLAAAAQSPSLYSVHGLVTDAVTGQPIARALVQISRFAAVLTDGGGRFDFGRIPAGYQSISAGKPGYVTRGFVNVPGAVPSFGIQPNPVNLDVGPATTEVVISLTPEAVISGTVRSASGQPLDRVSVQIYASEEVNGWPQWRVLGDARTNLSGAFHIGSLPTGKYFLVAQDGPSGMDWMYLPSYYPGKPDTGDYLELSAGTMQEVEIALTRQRTYPVAITVSTPESNGYPPRVSDDEALQLPIGGSYQNGAYELLLPNGTWTLEESRYGQDAWYGRTRITVAGAPVAVSLAALPYPPVPVEIERESTQPTPANSGQWLGANLTLYAAHAPPLATQVMASVQSHRHRDGTTTYDVPGVSPGQYWLVSESGDMYVSSAFQAGWDLADQPAMLGPSAPPIEITLRNDFATIAAKVVDPGPNQLDGAIGEGPGPGWMRDGFPAYVCAIPLFPTTERPIVVNLGRQAGSAYASGEVRLPPGSYRLLAFRHPVDLPGRSSDLAAAWVGKGQVVDVAPGQTANVTLSTISSQSFDGDRQ